MIMKLKLLILMLGILSWSCAKVQSNPAVLPATDEVSARFSTAENYFLSNSYENALKAYQEFLEIYPLGAQADLALMRIATLYSIQEKHDLSLQTYRRLIVEHPDSEMVIAAMVESMIILSRKGEFKKVIDHAAIIIEKTESKTHRSRAYEILGDAYLSLRSPKEAIFFYQLARFSEKEKIELKLKTAVDQLNEEDLVSLLRELNDPLFTSYFLFELGLCQVQKKNYNAALSIFSRFTTQFPLHERKHQAQKWIAEINERLAFKRRRIGCLLPLTGPYEAFGNRALKGIQLALDRYNDQNQTPEFEMLVKDTRSDPEAAINAVRQFDERGVSAIIGPLATSEYAAREAQERGIPIITLTQKTGIPELGDYVFRMFLTPQMQIDTLVPYVVNRLGIKRFAVLYPEEIYGNTFLKIFQEKALDHGATLVAVESYQPEQTDFAQQIKKICKTLRSEEDGSRQHVSRKSRFQKRQAIVDFDAIFIPDTTDKIALIAPQLAFYDIDGVLLLGTNLWHSDKLIHAARDYVQEAIMADVFYAEDSKPHVREFIAAFEKTHGHLPGFIEAIAYDTAMVNLYVLNNPKIRSRNDLKNGLKNLRDFEGVTGYTSFMENGDAAKKLYLLQIEKNRFVQLN
jgi:ABC-type branched-subunit amino acid transport system substrate-binding protein/predicted negative regulator of RcsB-dependent stress response